MFESLPLTPEAFAARFNAHLKLVEKSKTFGRLRELQDRISKGKANLARAGAPEVAERIEGKLAELRAEIEQIRREQQVPYFALATADDFYKASRGWGLPKGSYLRIEIPGVFNIAVDLSEDEPPF